MTLLFVDGFDNESSADTINLKWTTGAATGGGGSFASSSTTPYGVGKSFQSLYINFNTGSSAIIRTDLGVNRSTLTAGFIIQLLSPTSGTNNGIFFFMDGAIEQLALVFAGGSNKLAVYRGNLTTLLGTGTTVLFANRWYYVELQATFTTGATGSYTVKLDGQTELTGSSVQTTTSGVAQANRLLIGARGLTSQIASSYLYDDFYCCDSLGAVNNTFIGPLRVVGLLPTTAGTNAQLAIGGSSPAGTNVASVNEANQDADVTYVSSLTVGQYDTYNFADLPASATSVLGVVAVPVIKRDDVGSRFISARVRSGGTEADSATSVQASLSYAFPQIVMETNPVTTTTWTVSDVNGMELGPKIAA